MSASASTFTPASGEFRLDHVAFGVERLAAAARVLVGELGGRPHEGGTGSGFRWAQWRFAEDARLEGIEPDGPPGGFLHRFLARHGPGVHHVTFKVPELAAAAERARGFGYEIVGYDDSQPSWRECFLHPKQAHGLVVQLAQSDPTAEDGSWSDFPFPPAPAEPPPPVSIVALRLAAASLDAALRQWSGLLGGTAHEEDGALRFVWPDSPIAIEVAAEPDASEGPRALEISAARPLDVAATPHPELGTRLLVVERGMHARGAGTG